MVGLNGSPPGADRVNGISGKKRLHTWFFFYFMWKLESFLIYLDRFRTEIKIILLNFYRKMKGMKIESKNLLKKKMSKKIVMKNLENKRKKSPFISFGVVIHVAEAIWTSKNVVTWPNAAGMSLVETHDTHLESFMYHHLITKNTTCIFHICIRIRVWVSRQDLLMALVLILCPTN